MTTLTGYQGDDFVCLVADSQITEDNLRTISTSTPKIITRGKYVLGIVGDSRPGDILTYNWKPPVYKSIDDPIQHMGMKVIPSIISALTKAITRGVLMTKKVALITSSPLMVTSST
jgi:hypothetical protein